MAEKHVSNRRCLQSRRSRILLAVFVLIAILAVVIPPAVVVTLHKKNDMGPKSKVLCLSMCTLHPEPGLRLKMCMFSAHVHLDLGHLGLAESFSQH